MSGMQLNMQLGQRMEQRQILAPRMIQSMEILQLPIMDLQARIRQELDENPALELQEPTLEELQAAEEAARAFFGARAVGVGEIAERQIPL